ncbi:MAG: ATP-grasp domain-containing protein [Methanomassiliicoccaceae archaeon]|nr:ATP-grasp domain-containing protein [Methanomassiliicoccaceae archaeon]
MTKSVLVAGMAGASLGTEIIKSLSLCNKKYQIFGCDISKYAYGHYMPELKKSFVVSSDDYVQNIINVCKMNDISLIVPGSDITTVLLGKSKDLLDENGIQFAGNNADTIKMCSNKATLFEFFKKTDIKIPATYEIKSSEELPDIAYPCIIKPATESGGSVSVFIVKSKSELKLYAEYMLCNNIIPIVQEYMSHETGEFTVGVLHSPEGKLFGSIALKRMFHAKISISQKSEAGLISSGYSQGEINDYEYIRKTAEKIAQICGSTGPLNVQGRLKNGEFCPFEVNPRFSASTHLRALAGFNEIDSYIDMISGIVPKQPDVRCGFYLRSFNQVFVSPDMVIEK